MKSKEIEKYEIMKLKYAEDTRAHGRQLRQLQFRRTRLGCPRRSFRSSRRPPEAAWATIARVAGPRRPRVGRPRFEHRRPDADATAADDVLHFGGVLWSQVEHAAAASGMPRLHRGTERAAGVTAGVDEAGGVIEESTNNKSSSTNPFACNPPVTEPGAHTGSTVCLYIKDV